MSTVPRTVTIKLADHGTKPLVGHEGLISEVELSEPSYDLYQELGEPRQFFFGPNDVPVPIEDKDVIRQYIERCLVRPTDPAILAQGGIRLGRALKTAMLGFFRFGDEADEASTTSPTSSSSTDASPSTPAP